MSQSQPRSCNKVQRSNWQTQASWRNYWMFQWNKCKACCCTSLEVVGESSRKNANRNEVLGECVHLSLEPASSNGLQISFHSWREHEKNREEARREFMRICNDPLRHQERGAEKTHSSTDSKGQDYFKDLLVSWNTTCHLSQFLTQRPETLGWVDRTREALEE